MAILKKGEAVVPVVEVCRKHAISAPTYYAWKRMYADLALESAAIKDVLSKRC